MTTKIYVVSSQIAEGWTTEAAFTDHDAAKALAWRLGETFHARTRVEAIVLGDNDLPIVAEHFAPSSDV